MATLLSICTRAMDKISSFNVPTFIVGNEDDTAKTLLACARDVGEELVRDYDWQEMARTAAVTTVDGTSLYDLAEDYDRIASDTMWDGTERRHMRGQTTKREWSMIRNSQYNTELEYRWRLYRKQIQLEPAAQGVFSFNYEYLSKVYCTNTDGLDRVDGWVDDTDEPILPADIFTKGIEYYFRKAKGLPYGDAAAEYDAVIMSRSGKNTPSRAVNMAESVVAPGRDHFRLNIPDRIDV